MKPFRVLAKNHTAEEAQKLLELAVDYGANFFDYVEGLGCSAIGVAFAVDYADCVAFGVDATNCTFITSYPSTNTDEPLTYEQAEAHIKASAK